MASRTHFAAPLLLAVFVALILYVSLYPFGFAADGPPAPAPVLKPGDRWVYSGRDGFRDPLLWDETREVVAASAAGMSSRYGTA